MRIVKIILAVGANLFTSYFLIRGIQDPEIIGYIKEYHGVVVQPGTLFLQIAGFLILGFAHTFILTYLVHKLNK